MNPNAPVKEFDTEEAARQVVTTLRNRPSRSHRKFVVAGKNGRYRIRRDVYYERTVRCTWLCVDSRFRHTGEY